MRYTPKLDCNHFAKRLAGQALASNSAEHVGRAAWDAPRNPARVRSLSYCGATCYVARQPPPGVARASVGARSALRSVRLYNKGPVVVRASRLSPRAKTIPQIRPRLPGEPGRSAPPGPPQTSPGPGMPPTFGPGGPGGPRGPGGPGGGDGRTGPRSVPGRMGSSGPGGPGGPPGP